VPINHTHSWSHFVQQIFFQYQLMVAFPGYRPHDLILILRHEEKHTNISHTRSNSKILSAAVRQVLSGNNRGGEGVQMPVKQCANNGNRAERKAEGTPENEPAKYGSQIGESTGKQGE